MIQTGKTIRGAVQLGFDSIEAVTNIAEGMYRNIAAAPLPWSAEPQGSAKGIAGFVHTCIRTINHTNRTTAEKILRPLEAYLDQHYLPGSTRETLVATLNGVCGDHLANTNNPLAIPMQLRLYGHEYSSQQARTFAQSKPSANTPINGKLLLGIHGLCMHDGQWQTHQGNHIDDIARAGGYTPIYLRYNTGQHISSNGRELADHLKQLIMTWPVPVTSISAVGFSMGGLVLRSALYYAELHHAELHHTELHQAEQTGQHWPEYVDKAIYYCSPHHGSVIERGGFRLQQAVAFSPYTSPLAALGKLRSAGITDLRHGNILDNHWQTYDEHTDNLDHRTAVPLTAGIQHHALAVTLSKTPGQHIGRLLGDGLVHPSSATGRHSEANMNLPFPPENQRILYGIGHLHSLSNLQVKAQLQEWLTS